jgi:hypothetical protein
MKKIILFLGLMAILACNSTAQKLISVEAKEIQPINENISVAQFKNQVLETAKFKALADKFGTLLVQGTDMTVKSQNTQSSVDLTNISNALVKGEWIKSDKEECKWILDQKGKEQVLYLECAVEGKAREIPEAKISFEAITMKCPDKKICATTQYENKQPLMLNFKAAKSGYLTVYMREQGKVYRLLPYPAMRNDLDAAVPVEADKEYVLFSYQNKNYFPGGERATLEYNLFTEKEQMFNRIYVLYSPKPIAKPILTEDESGLKTIEPEAFATWLNKLKVSSPEVQEKVIFVSVTK